MIHGSRMVIFFPQDLMNFLYFFKQASLKCLFMAKMVTAYFFVFKYHKNNPITSIKMLIFSTLFLKIYSLGYLNFIQNNFVHKLRYFFDKKNKEKWKMFIK